MARDTQPHDQALPDTVFQFAWKHTRKQQLWVLAIVLLSMPTYFLALDLPKRIVNGPIQGTSFPTSDTTQSFLQIAFDLPGWLGGNHVELFSGFDLGRMDMLVALCFAFLFLVFVNGMFKFYINVFKGRLGERTLRRLRYELIDRVLRFPMNHFKRVKQSEVASMVKDEVEPIGGFVGEAFVTPVFLGGHAATALAFIIIQNFWLGTISAAIVGLQAVLIPRLRRRQIELGRKRQLTARQLAGRVGELVDGISAVHVNDTSNFERADISARLGKIFAIRYELFQRKFFVKFLNNFLAQVTPFLFYLLGGYYVLNGELDIGQLAAVIVAYKDLPAPIKDLINWDQERLDVQVKYAQVTEQFNAAQMIDPQLQQVKLEPVPALKDGYALSGLSIEDDTGNKLLDNVSTRFSLSEHIAIVGGLHSGGEALASALGRLLPETAGEIKLEKSNLSALPVAKTGRRIGYVPAEVALFSGTLGDNLLYGLKHAPFSPKQYSPDYQSRRQWQINEARQSGNTDLDVKADWTNYQAAGAKDHADLIEIMMAKLQWVDLLPDVINFGLRGFISGNDHEGLVEKILAARKDLRERIAEKPNSDMVELFDPDVYAAQATIAENLIFGTHVDQDSSIGASAAINNENLRASLFNIGREMASTAIELFSDLDPGHPFFEQLSFMSGDELPDYQVLLNRIKGQSFESVSDADRQKLVELSFGYIEPRHRFGLLDDDLRADLLKARKSFKAGLSGDARAAIEFYDPDKFNHASSIEDNLLLGRIAYGVAEGEKNIRQLLSNVLDEHDLYDEVFTVGLEFEVGTGGKRLSPAQRQKLGLARALLKRPDFLIVNRSLTSLDRAGQEQIVSNVLNQSRKTQNHNGLIWVLANPSIAKQFDRVLVMEQGRVVEDGKPDDLLARNGKFAKLVM